MNRVVNKFTFWVKNEKKRQKLNEFLGFAIVGVAMTLATIVLNYLFLKILDCHLLTTYIVVGVLTIFFSYLLNTFLVFKQKFSLVTMFIYYGIYLSGMVIGALVLSMLNHVLTESAFPKFLLEYRKFLLSIMPIPVTLIWNFVFTSQVMKNKKIAKILRPQ